MIVADNLKIQDELANARPSIPLFSNLDLYSNIGEQIRSKCSPRNGSVALMQFILMQRFNQDYDFDGTNFRNQLDQNWRTVYLRGSRVLNIWGLYVAKDDIRVLPEVTKNVKAKVLIKNFIRVTCELVKQ